VASQVVLSSIELVNLLSSFWDSRLEDRRSMSDEHKDSSSRRRVPTDSGAPIISTGAKSSPVQAKEAQTDTANLIQI
jgi:hypothetical protein